MDYINTHSINLRALFREFKTKEELKLGQKNKRILEEVTAADFLTILHCLDFGWTEEEYMDIIELVATPGRVIQSKKRRSVKAYLKKKKKKKGTKRGEYRVTLKHLKRFETSTTDRLIVMATVICFMLYPTISKKVFSSMSCFYGLMDGDYDWYLNADLEIACTSPSHIWFVVTIILPVIIVFIIGYPAVCVYNIWRVKKRHKRLTERTSFRYAVFLSGYDRVHWYWESVTCMRKVLITMIAVFLGSFGPEKQFFFASLLLISSMVIQLHIRPFENKELNVFETSGLGILWFSLYFGIFFYWMLLSPDALGHLGTLIAMINAGFLFWGLGSWFREKVSRTQSSEDSNSKNLCRRICLKDTKNPFALMLLAIPLAFYVLYITAKGAVNDAYRGMKKLIRVSDGVGHVTRSLVLNPTHLQRNQIHEMRLAIGMHINEMKQLALAKEKEIYRARLKMLNDTRVRTKEEEAMILKNMSGKNKLDIVAKTGNFVKKVGIIRAKRKKRKMREERNRRLRELGLDPPTDGDDSMFDFLNGSLLSNVMEIAGGDDEFVDVDPTHDEELMELFNYGNDSGESEDEVAIADDLMKMFGAPDMQLEIDNMNGGIKFVDSEEEEEADFFAELEKDLLFLSEDEGAAAREKALEEYNSRKLADAEAKEKELKEQIESMKDGIQSMIVQAEDSKRSRKERFKARRNRRKLGVRRSEGTDLDDFMSGKTALHTEKAVRDGSRRYLSLAEERKERRESLNTQSRQEHRKKMKHGSATATSLDSFDNKSEGSNMRETSKGGEQSKERLSKNEKFMKRKAKRQSRKTINTNGSEHAIQSLDSFLDEDGGEAGGKKDRNEQFLKRKAKRQSRKTIDTNGSEHAVQCLDSFLDEDGGEAEGKKDRNEQFLKRKAKRQSRKTIDTEASKQAVQCLDSFLDENGDVEAGKVEAGVVEGVGDEALGTAAEQSPKVVEGVGDEDLGAAAEQSPKLSRKEKRKSRKKSRARRVQKTKAEAAAMPVPPPPKLPSFCPKCGTATGGGKFCPSCGASLQNSKAKPPRKKSGKRKNREKSSHSKSGRAQNV